MISRVRHRVDRMDLDQWLGDLNFILKVSGCRVVLELTQHWDTGYLGKTAFLALSRIFRNQRLYHFSCM